MTRFTTRPEIKGTFGVVATTHWIASAVAMGMLERGGNAFDAAVAAGFTLQVVEPHLNGPGGDMPAIVYSAASDRVQVLCGQGPAPRAASIEAFRDLGLDMIPGTGLLAATVPGAFDAWLLMLRDHGTMRLRDVLEPAIAYARDGHPLLPRVADTIAGVRAMFLAHWPSSAATWLEDGEAPAPHALFRNPVLAETWERLLGEAEAAGGGREAQIEAARTAWYRGFVAEAVDRFCRTQEVMDVSGRAHRGLLTGEDMARWSASWEAPLTFDYHGHTLCKTGPWGQGPAFLQTLALLEGFDLAAMDPDGPDFVHTVTECLKLAFADREAYYGDPDFVDVPMGVLLSKDYNDARRKLVGETASLELRPGHVPGFERQVGLARSAPAAAGTAEGAGEPTMAHLAEQRSNGEVRGDTCHVDVIDRWGNMVSATPSGGWLQSSPVIPELGFALGSRAQMFRLEEGAPSSLAPGKRPRTTLSPSLLLRGGRPYMAFGTPGGDQQDQWQPIFLLRHLHHGLNLQEAIDAPLFHSEHFPGSFWPRASKPGHLQIEASFPKETLRELVRRGHLGTIQPPWSIGRLCAAARDGKLLSAAATPRLMQAYAVGR
ncbi:gamma-glutamyltransferase family protein [Marinimicrococcus flavescens]|uniref:Gamma-glutamyltransferase family protein n=1 Tax=Marinimicrococcus flavescens TaxID=3031815 RepID=A0AAP3XRY2_9PROT|nr:gamma-glutamyltransferase family protein [Marinimicrococcus flavescens]